MVDGREPAQMTHEVTTKNKCDERVKEYPPTEMPTILPIQNLDFRFGKTGYGIGKTGYVLHLTWIIYSYIFGGSS